MKTEPSKPGPKKHDTAISTGVAVTAMAEAGETPGQIAEDLSVSLTLVEAILTGKGKWANLKTDAALQQWRQKQTRGHELMARELSTKLLQRVEDTIPNASLSQAVIAFGILQDKARLLAGESTQNIAFGGTVRMESEKLTDMLAKLVSSLTQEPIDAEIITAPVETKETSCTETQESSPATGLGLSDGTG